MYTIIINGTNIQTKGRNISINKNSVLIDGKTIMDNLGEKIHIKIGNDLGFFKYKENIGIYCSKLIGNLECNAVESVESKSL